MIHVEKRSPVPVPEQSVFDSRVFSEKKTPSNRLKCPSPPLKTPPVSRIFSDQPLITPTAKVITTPGFLTNQFTPETAGTSLFEGFFENLGEIGAGSFGCVYKARSKVDSRLYAIKRSRHQFRGTKDRQRAIGEVWYAAQLPPHPHVLHYINAWEELGYLFIQTELCSKGSLKGYLEANAPLDEEKIWGFLLDMVLGIQHIHSHNLLHLDMKPANLFLSEEGNLKIGDFGLVHQLEDTSYDSEGDSRYMALELLGEDPLKVSLPADIFCIGATCFEMAANVDMPANGTAWVELRHGHVTQHLSTTHASLELQNLIGLMMSPDPCSRPTAEQLLSHWKLHQLFQQRHYPGQFMTTLNKNSNLEALPQISLHSPQDSLITTPSSSPSYFPRSFSLNSPISNIEQPPEDDDEFLMPRHTQEQEFGNFRVPSLDSYHLTMSKPPVVLSDWAFKIQAQRPESFRVH